VLEFCCSPAPEDEAQMRAATAGQQRYAVLSPSAGWAAKRWPEEAFAALALRIRRELELPVVINCGPGEEQVAGRVAELAAEAGLLVLCPSLGELMALVGDAALVVGGDTGPVHLAAACGTPVVAIFGPTDPERNGPFGSACRVVRAEAAPTTYSRAADPEAIGLVKVEQVFRAAADLLPAR
ncbi:MAG: glycosyltransferase family 9 protein, partial [bacterium]